MAEELRFEHIFRIPRDRVFAHFADSKKLGRLWRARWSRLTPSAQGDHPDGLGSVREVKAGAFRWEETVTAFKPPELIEYTISKGANVKNHHARIRFDEVRGGTKVTYEVRFDAKIPGTGRMFAATMRLGWTIGIPKVEAALEREQ